MPINGVLIKYGIKIIPYILGCFIISTFLHSSFGKASFLLQDPLSLQEKKLIIEQKSKIRQALKTYIQTNQYPQYLKTFIFDTEPLEVKIEYSFNSILQNKAKSLLEHYQPDYGAIVVLNAETGEILALQSYEKSLQYKKNTTSQNWTLYGGFPAASIFKIITASVAIDQKNLPEDLILLFNGGNYSLYRKNLILNQINRWTRITTLKEAFAQSFNIPFGRLTLEHLSPEEIEQYAHRFGFNQSLESDFPFEMGTTQIPSTKDFNLAEIVSGFNRITKISPIHGAMIAASIAHDGIMLTPTIIKTIRDQNDNIIYRSQPIIAGVTVSPEGAKKLRNLMKATIERGTSRKSFRQVASLLDLADIEIGGKTGSLTNDFPKGKIDWFIGYGLSHQKEKIAVAALSIHEKNWKVKSSYLAREILMNYFKDNLKYTSAAKKTKNNAEN